MSDDHEGRDGCLERTSFPLFHPKKSKILPRTGSERARKLDRYGGTSIEELEDEGYRGGSRNIQTEEMTDISGTGSRRQPVEMTVDAAHGASSSAAGDIGQYLMNPLLAMGMQLPQLALFLQQQQHINKQKVTQSGPLPVLGPLHAPDKSHEVIPTPLTEAIKNWSCNIPAFPQHRSGSPVGFVSSTSTVPSGVVQSIRPMVQAPRENQQIQIQKEDSVSSSNSSGSKHPFVCEICRQWFFAKEKLIMHLVMNHNKHYCRFCSELFDIAEMRDVHIVRTHLPLPCDLCQCLLPGPEALYEHYLNTHDVQSCLYCGVLVRPKSYYSTHTKKKHFVSNRDILENDAKVRIFRNWGPEIGNGGSVWNFTCNLCGKERKKSETFGHFFSYHRVSLPCLMQLLTGEGISISVQGTPPVASSGLRIISEEPSVPTVSDTTLSLGNSAANSDENRSGPSICTVCSNSFTQQVPKTAHDLFCRGLNICRVCEQVFPNEAVRNAHATTEHGKLSCRIGCPTESVKFSLESELSAHYWENHDIFVCTYCKSLVAADKHLFAEHLKREHNCSLDCSALQGNGFGTDIFQCKNSNFSCFIHCSLCDSDITTIMKDINLLFKHLHYHKISVSAALDLLEKQLPISNNGAHQPGIKAGVSNELAVSVISGNQPQSISSHSSPLDKECSGLGGDGKSGMNVQSLIMSDTSAKRVLEDISCDEIVMSGAGENGAAVSKNVFLKSTQKEERSGEPLKSNKQVKPRGKTVEKNGERSGPSKLCEDTNYDSSSDLQSSDEDFGLSEGEAVDNEYTEEDGESTATEEQKPGGGAGVVPSDIAEAEFDPHDIECVFTDTSDDECEDAQSSLDLTIKREFQEMNEEEEEEEISADSSLLHAGQDSRGNTRVKTEPGGDTVNTINPPMEMMCEVCNGHFLMEEGPRELARHMNLSHGFSVATYGVKEFVCDERQCGESFGSQRALQRHLADVHDGPLVQPHDSSLKEFGCPFCAVRSRSKPALRQHIIMGHQEERMREQPPPELAYPCRHCDVIFWKADDRNDHHVLKHEDQIENYYKCFTCQRVYASKLCLNRHVRLDHPNQKRYTSLAYKCCLCLVLVPATSMLRAHFQECHPSALVFHCHRCNTTLKTKKTLKCHIKNVHSEERRRDCSLCGKVLWSKRAYAIHFRMKHSAQSKVGFRCRICQQRFDSKDERKLHYQIDHSGESPYHCAECGKGFASKSGMYGHRQLHTGSGISKCEYCGKEFTRKDSYNEHLLIHNGPRHKCPHCPKEFVQRSNLVRHIRIHTGEKPYKCLYCEKCFSDKGACNSHIRVHTREETCSCPYCGQTFSKKQKLKYHIRKHTGEGLMTCEICNKTFTNSFALKEHRVIHNRQTQILCQQCGKGFNSEKYLQRHVAIVHEPTKIFACPLCPKVFSQHGRLKAHLMTHTGVKHMKCLLCEKAYSVRKSLRRHLLEKHQVSPEHPQYKNCFYAMSAAEAGLLIPEGAGPFVPPEDDSTSQSKDGEDYRPKKPPARKYNRKTPGRKGSGRRVSEGAAEGVDVKKPRRKYNTKKRQREAAEAAAAAAAAAAADAAAYSSTISADTDKAVTTTAADPDTIAVEAEVPSPSTSVGGPARRTRQKSSPKLAMEVVYADFSSSGDEEPPTPPPVKRRVGRLPKRQQHPVVMQSKKMQLAGKKKCRVEAIVEILQKTSSSPSSVSPSEEKEEEPSDNAALAREQPNAVDKDDDDDDGSGDGPVLAKILPLNFPQKQKKVSTESHHDVFSMRTRVASVESDDAN